MGILLPLSLKPCYYIIYLYFRVQAGWPKVALTLLGHDVPEPPGSSPAWAEANPCFAGAPCPYVLSSSSSS